MRYLQLASILVLLALVSILGCIDGNTIEFIRYDKASDSFVFLSVFTNLATNDADELTQLSTLWKNRANLMHDFNPRFELFAGPRMLLRIDRQTYQPIYVARAGKRPEPIRTNARLDQVTVSPGQFFKNEHGNLSYSHQTTVPGKVIDQIITESTAEIADGISSLAEWQLGLRRTTSDPVPTWDVIRQSLIAEMLGGQSPEIKNKQILPFETQSLRALIKCALDRSFSASRREDRLVFAFPLSESDCNELVATFDLVKDASKSKDLQRDKVPPYLSDLMNAVTLQKKAANEIEITLSIRLLSPLMLREEKMMPNPNAEARLKYPTTIASVKAKGIPIAENDIFESIVNQFSVDAKK
ncbi:MAG: hypothetical protein NTY19_47210 [Planctomycetota bacterium]|nr:hypothetical protein [Planctomycetota bacterium]